MIIIAIIKTFSNANSGFEIPIIIETTPKILTSSSYAHNNYNYFNKQYFFLFPIGTYPVCITSAKKNSILIYILAKTSQVAIVIHIYITYGSNCHMHSDNQGNNK